MAENKNESWASARRRMREVEHFKRAAEMQDRYWLWAAVDGCQCNVCEVARRERPSLTGAKQHAAFAKGLGKAWRPIDGCVCSTCTPTPPALSEHNGECSCAWCVGASVGRARGYVRADAPVERELSCPTCRRVFCRVMAPPAVTITVLCEGCAREGRGPDAT